MNDESSARGRWLARSSNAAEWRRMTTALELGEGFQFFVVQVDDSLAASFLAELVAERFDALPPWQLRLGPDTRVSEILDHLRAAPRPSLPWLVGDAPGPALEPLFSLLNQKREVVSEIADGPFVLALHPLVWRHFRRSAPDFWSIHQAVFHFSPGREGVVEHFRRARPRPEFAAPQTSGAGTWRLDPDDVRAFVRGRVVGRDNELRRLRAFLRDPGGKVLIWGPPGVGKTALVDELLPDLVDRYPGGIWRIQIGPRTRTVEDYARSLLSELLAELRPGVRVPEDLDALQRQFAMATTLRSSNRATNPVLFVFEDLDDPQLFELLRPGNRASVIVTSRVRQSAEHFDQVIALAGLSPKAAKSTNLVAELLDPSRLSDDARDMWAALSWFIGAFEQADAAAVTGLRDQRVQAALDELVDHAVIELVAPQRYRMPELLRDLATQRIELSSVRDRPEILRGYVRRVLIDWSVPPNDPNLEFSVAWLLSRCGSLPAADIDDEDWALLRGAALQMSSWPRSAPPRTLVLAQAVAEHRGDFEVLANIYGWNAWHAEMQEQHDAAAQWFTRRLDALERVHGPRHATVLTTLLELARLAAPEARRAHLDRAIELADALANIELQVIVRTLLAAELDDAEAEATLTQALELANQDEELRATVYLARAQLAHRRGALEEARSWAERALASGGPAWAIAELAEKIPDLELAVRACTQMLDEAERLGDVEIQTISMTRLGELSIALGDLDTAQDWLERALAIGEQFDQAHFPLVPLARLDRIRGDLDAAVAKLVRAYPDMRILDLEAAVLDELRACAAAAQSEAVLAQLRSRWEAAGFDWNDIAE